MFYTRPNITLNSFYEEPQTKTDLPSWGELARAGRDEGNATSSFMSEAWNQRSVYNDHIDKVQQLTGTKLDYPELDLTDFENAPKNRETQDRMYADWAKFQKEGGGLRFDSFLAQWSEREFRKKLEDLAVKHPGLRDQLLPQMSFLEMGFKRARDVSQKSQQTYERSNKTLADWTAYNVGGGLWSSAEDPVNWVTAPLGPFGRAGVGIKGMITMALKQGAANAAVEAGVQPFVQDYRSRAGLDSGLEQAFGAIGSAFLFGAGLDAGVRGVARGLRRGFGYEPIIERGEVVGWQKPDGSGRIDAETMAKADAGEPKAMREVAETSGLADDPVMRQKLDAMDANEVILTPPNERILEGDHTGAMVQNIRHAADPVHEPPMVRIEETPPAKIKELAELSDDLLAYAKKLLTEVDERVVGAAQEAVQKAAPDAPVRLAEAFRVHPELITDALPMDTGLYQTARALSRLSPEAFDRVASGEVPVPYAKMVADHVADPAYHDRALSDLMASQPTDPTQARHILAEHLQSPDYKPPVPEPDATGTGLAQRQLDDPYGPEAKAQVETLERTMREEMGILGPEDGNPEEWIGEMVSRADEVRKAIDEVAGLVPEGVTVRTFDAVSDLPPEIQGRVHLMNAAALNDAMRRFQDAQTPDEKLSARRMMDLYKQGQGVEGLADGTDIWIATFALDPKGRVAHEVVHALRMRGQIAPEELAILAQQARKSGVFDAKTEGLYKDELSSRFDDAQVADLLQEEGAARLIEAHVRGEDVISAAPEVGGILNRLMQFFEQIGNALRGKGFLSSADVEALNRKGLSDILDQFMSGEMAKRPEVVEWMRSNGVPRDRNLMAAIRGEDNLDMSPEARLARAREMGFDTENIWYRGMNYAHDTMKPMSFWARSKHQANEYTTPSEYNDANITPAYLKKGNYFDPEKNPEHFALIKQAVESGEVLPPIDRPFQDRLDKVFGKKFVNYWWPKYWRERGNYDLRNLDRQGMMNNPKLASIITHGANDSIIKFLKKEGFDGFVGYELPEKHLPHVAVFDPRNIRSINARFDPREEASANLMAALRTEDNRSIDSLGYYSKALEVARGLKQAKGTPEQMLAQLKTAGVKDAEIEATGLKGFLEGQKQVTRDDLVKYLDENRVRVSEVRYGGEIPIEQREMLTALDQLNARYHSAVARQREGLSFRQRLAGQRLEDPAPIKAQFEALKAEYNSRYEPLERHEQYSLGKGKWSSYSLDPNNPTYRESVVHLPIADDEIPSFQSGHFPEPNIVGHMMTSMTKHEGKPVFTLDQIQSDWGQKLRDGGVRDEAKIAALEARIGAVRKGEGLEARLETIANDPTNIERYNAEDALKAMRDNGWTPERLVEQARELGGVREADALKKFLNGVNNDEVTRLEAELITAKAATPGNPLVNTTDQWTNTILRRALKQAVDDGAEYIAIPHGDTVLSYNPGDETGMPGFYGSRNSEGIVPKNLRKILEKIDKDAAKPVKVETLQTSQGPRGYRNDTGYTFDKSQTGFTLFPITDKVRQTVTQEGQPLFALRTEDNRAKLGAKERAAQLKADLTAIEAQFNAAHGDERVKLQAKRAALINAKKAEELLDKATGWRDVFGRQDRAKAMMFTAENYYEAPFIDLTHLRDEVFRKAGSFLGETAWNMRKGVISGDLRRRLSSVKNFADNIILEIGGKSTNDPMAKEMAKGVSKSFDYLRQRFNAAGGDIGKLENYFPQYHDADAIRSKPEDWLTWMTKDGNLDRERMAPGMNREDFRKLMQEMRATIMTDGWSKRDADAFRGTGALYKRHAEHRVIHFASPEKFLEYNKLFGGGDVWGAIVGHLHRMSRDIALMETYGTNPKLTLERVFNTLMQDAQFSRAGQSLLGDLNDKLNALNAQLKEPLATDDIFLKMGNIHTELDTLRRSMKGMQWPGRRGKIRDRIWALDVELMELHDQLRAALDFPEPNERQMSLQKDIAATLDEIETAETWSATRSDPVGRVEYYKKRTEAILEDYMGRETANRFVANVSQASRNIVGAGILQGAGLSALSDQAIAMAGRTLIGMPAFQHIPSFIRAFTSADKKLALQTAIGLEKSFSVTLREHARHAANIDARTVTGFMADRTHALSMLTALTENGKQAFNFDFMGYLAHLQDYPWSGLPKAARSMLETHGITPDDWKLLREVRPEYKRGVYLLTRDAIEKQLGVDLAEKVAIMRAKEQGMTIIEGTARNRSLLIGTNPRGSVAGEMAQNFTMLKSFGSSYVSLVALRIFQEMIKQGVTANTVGAATFVLVGGMLFGGVIMQLKNLAYGRDPQDMTTPKFWMQAFMQSGGLGIYGDFISSAQNRYGGGLAGTIAGPMAEFAGAPLAIAGSPFMTYAMDQKTNPGRETVKFLRRYTPGALVPVYARLAYDRMVLDNLQRVLDPDAHKSFRSQAQALRKRTKQEYFYPPGGTYRDPNLSAAFGN